MMWLNSGILILCAILWAIGGSYNKNWRRIGVPYVCLLYLCVVTGTLSVGYIVSAILLWGTATIGYGESSPLYKWWKELVKEDIVLNSKELHEITNFFVRITCGFAYSLSMIFWAKTVVNFSLVIGLIVILTQTSKWQFCVGKLTSEELIIGVSIGGGVVLCLL